LAIHFSQVLLGNFEFRLVVQMLNLALVECVSRKSNLLETGYVKNYPT